MAVATLAVSARATADPDARPTIAGVAVKDVSDTGFIKIRLDNLETVDPREFDRNSFRLRLDGHRLDSIPPQFLGPELVAFDLSSLETNDRPDWLDLVGGPPPLGIRAVEVGIATSNADLLANGNQRFTVGLRIFPAYKALLALILLVGLVAWLWKVGPATGMLRDPPTPETSSIQQRPYSLARCQMAFWLVVITMSFIAIVGITGDYNGIVTTQSLTLLGISSLTAFGAEAMDSARPKPQIVAGQAAVEPPRHNTFLRDLLTDDSGFALHRVQILVWTLILGVVSLWSTYRSLTLPNFDPQLLIMMGITSGLYLGFKWPEKQTDSPLPTG